MEGLTTARDKWGVTVYLNGKPVFSAPSETGNPVHTVESLVQVLNEAHAKKVQEHNEEFRSKFMGVGSTISWQNYPEASYLVN